MQQSAKDAYRDRMHRARALLVELTRLLDDHAIAHVREPERWDLVGDLGALNEMLDQAIATLQAGREYQED